MSDESCQAILTRISEKSPKMVLVISTYENGIQIDSGKATVGDLMLFERVLRQHLDRVCLPSPASKKSLLER